MLPIKRQEFTMTYNEFHNLVAMVRDLLNYRLMGNDRFLRTEYRRYGETCAEIIACQPKAKLSLPVSVGA